MDRTNFERLLKEGVFESSPKPVSVRPSTRSAENSTAPGATNLAALCPEANDRMETSLLIGMKTRLGMCQNASGGTSTTEGYGSQTAAT